MVKYFVELDCPDYQKINEDIIKYLKNNTSILEINPNNDPDIESPYPNFVDNVDFVKNNPKLIEYFSGLGMKLFQVYYAVAFYSTNKNKKNSFTEYGNPAEVSTCPIHLDRPPVQWKMNWPVMNMIDTGVRFWKLKNEGDSIEQYVVRSGVPGSLARDAWELPYEPFEECARHVFGPAPILMNGLVPHDVWFNDAVPTPRVGLQIMFFKEPRHLLDKDCIILD